MALIVALMSMLLLTALGLALMMTTITETMIANNYREGSESMYAADAGVERVMQDLLTVPDWNRILAGLATVVLCRRRVDRHAHVARRQHDRFDAGDQHDQLRKAATCSAADLTAWTAERPYGQNNPGWSLVAYAPLADIIETGTMSSPMYVVVWVADDIGETDNNPLIEGGAARGLPLRTSGAAFSDACRVVRPNGAKSMSRSRWPKTDTTELERGYTGQRGQDEQNRRARKAAVQTPGKALGRADVDLGTTTGGFVSR